MREMNLRALAKINLGLDVLGKREDGYHQVRMVMQTIQLSDDIILRSNHSGEITVKTNLSYLPVNENNLVYKAASLLKEEFQIKKGLEIELTKKIPVAAGLAGGSSDAAAVLFGINKMFRLKLSMEELMQRGVKIGADVPYCLMRGTALAEGIGEVLTPLDPIEKLPILIAKPGISVSTKFVYSNLKLDETTVHPDMDGLLEGIKQGDMAKITGSMGNVLESVTIPAYPVIAQIKELMCQEGALHAMMSGSGPTVFGIFPNVKAANKAKDIIFRSKLAKQVYVTGIYNNYGKTR